MAVTLGETLRHYIRGELMQKSVAIAWLDEMKRTEKKDWKSSHVESQLSRCLGNQLSAIRFFFGERTRGRALLDALEVPPGDFDQILQLADDTLAKHGERKVRLVVDVTPWSATVESRRLFEALRVSLVDAQPPKPAALLLTRTQYDDLPRSFDREADWLEIRCIDGSSDAEAFDSGALIASPLVQSDSGRWAAIGFDPSAGSLVFEPSDALDRFLRLGDLKLPPIDFDLSQYVDGNELPPPRAPGDVLERRRWMVHLRTEGDAYSVDPDPRVRLATARSLGIEALATQQDRLEHRLATAAAQLSSDPPMRATHEELDIQLARASRYPTDQTILRVGDDLHVINPPKTYEANGCVRVHHITAVEPAVRRLRGAIENWSVGDAECDPFLLDVMEKLAATPDEHLALLHARATIARENWTPKDPPPLDDWRASLAAIVAVDPPHAGLRFAARGWGQRSKSGWLATALKAVRPEDANVLALVASPFGVVVAKRSDEVGPVYETESGYNARLTNFAIAKPSSERDWIDSFETFIAQSPYPRGVPAVVMKSFEIATELWPNADRQLSLAWLALRRASTSSAVKCPDGSSIVRIGNGLGFTVRSSRLVGSVPTAALIDVTGLDRFEIVELCDSGLRHGQHTHINFVVPRPLILLHERSRIEIRFIGSPLLNVRVSVGELDDDDDYGSDDD